MNILTPLDKKQSMHIDDSILNIKLCKKNRTHKWKVNNYLIRITVKGGAMLKKELGHMTHHLTISEGKSVYSCFEWHKPKDRMKSRAS